MTWKIAFAPSQTEFHLQKRKSCKALLKEPECYDVVQLYTT